MSKYEQIEDEQLIRRLRDGEMAIIDYIMEKYKFMVRKKAKAMFLLGGENDDLIQEGMIGLFKAIRDYDLEKDASFSTFADLCVSRQMYTAIKNSQRQKHMPLNSYVSIYDEESEQPLIEQIQPLKENNPEELFLDKEYLAQVEQELKRNLSDFERRVLDLHLQGEDYNRIAQLLKKSSKSVDNALQRIKGKLKKRGIG